MYSIEKMRITDIAKLMSPPSSLLRARILHCRWQSLFYHIRSSDYYSRNINVRGNMWDRYE